MKHTQPLTFKTQDDFLDFLATYPETGQLFPDMTLNTPYDIRVKAFLALDWLVLCFGQYAQNPLQLKFSKQTHELFIVDMNEGGHVVRCRLVKISRDDILENSNDMLAWVENHAWKMWER